MSCVEKAAVRCKVSEHQRPFLDLLPKTNRVKQQPTFRQRNSSSVRFDRFRNFSAVLNFHYNNELCFLQINVSDERGSPEVICESKLLYAPPTSQDRIAGLAWQVAVVFKFDIHILEIHILETFMMWHRSKQRL